MSDAGNTLAQIREHDTCSYGAVPPQIMEYRETHVLKTLNFEMHSSSSKPCDLVPTQLYEIYSPC